MFHNMCFVRFAEQGWNRKRIEIMSRRKVRGSDATDINVGSITGKEQEGMTKWKRVTPIPPEYNGHGFLYECTKCHKVTIYFGARKLPLWDCKYCSAEVEPQESEET